MWLSMNILKHACIFKGLVRKINNQRKGVRESLDKGTAPSGRVVKIRSQQEFRAGYSKYRFKTLRSVIRRYFTLMEVSTGDPSWGFKTDI